MNVQAKADNNLVYPVIMYKFFYVTLSKLMRRTRHIQARKIECNFWKNGQQYSGQNHKMKKW